MGVKSLQTLAIIFFLIAALLLVVSVILFFVLKIPKMFGIVTGISAAKGIKEIQDRTEHQAEAKQAGKAKERVTQKIKKKKTDAAKANVKKTQEAVGVQLLNKSKKPESQPTTLLKKPAYQTTVLRDTDELTTAPQKAPKYQTTVLRDTDDHATQPLHPENQSAQSSEADSQITQPLADSGQTTVLRKPAQQPASKKKKGKNKKQPAPAQKGQQKQQEQKPADTTFQVVQEFSFTSSNEIIE